MQKKKRIFLIFFTFIFILLFQGCRDLNSKRAQFGKTPSKTELTFEKDLKGLYFSKEESGYADKGKELFYWKMHVVKEVFYKIRNLKIVEKGKNSTGEYYVKLKEPSNSSIPFVFFLKDELEYKQYKNIKYANINFKLRYKIYYSDGREEIEQIKGVIEPSTFIEKEKIKVFSWEKNYRLDEFGEKIKSIFGLYKAGYSRNTNNIIGIIKENDTLYLIIGFEYSLNYSYKEKFIKIKYKIDENTAKEISGEIINDEYTSINEKRVKIKISLELLKELENGKKLSCIAYDEKGNKNISRHNIEEFKEAYDMVKLQ